MEGVGWKRSADEAGLISAVRSSLECIICQDEFEANGSKIPKLLPCGHTLCAACLERLPKNRSQSSRCPECKHKFSAESKSSLPNNVSVIRVLGAFDAPGEEEAGFRCTVHKGAPLRVFCATCNLMLCFECAFAHRDHDVQDPRNMDEDLYIQHESFVHNMLDRCSSDLRDLRSMQARMDSSVLEVEHKSKAAERWILKEYQEVVGRLTAHKDALISQLKQIGGTKSRLLKRSRSAITDAIRTVEETRDQAFAKLQTAPSTSASTAALLSEEAGPGCSRVEVLCYEQQLRRKIAAVRALKGKLKSTVEGTALEIVPQQAPVYKLGELAADWRTPRVLYGTRGTGVGQLQSPSSVAVTPDGFILVADTMNDRIQILSASGEYRGELRDGRRIKSPVLVWFNAAGGYVGVMNKRGALVSLFARSDCIMRGASLGAAGLFRGSHKEGEGATAQSQGTSKPRPPLANHAPEPEEAQLGGLGDGGGKGSRRECERAPSAKQERGGSSKDSAESRTEQLSGGSGTPALTDRSSLALGWREQLGLEPTIDKEWKPTCIAVDAADPSHVAVAYSGESPRCMVELSRNCLSTADARHTRSSYIFFPEAECVVGGMAFDKAGRLLIANRAKHCLYVLREGQLEMQLGSEGSVEGSFRDPSAVAVDELGNVFVCDRGNHRVQVFSASLDLITVFGALGSMSGELNTPLGVAVGSDGFVCVADCGNHRVQVFNLPQRQMVGSKPSAGKGARAKKSASGGRKRSRSVPNLAAAALSANTDCAL